MISKDFLYKFTIPELSQIAGKKYINIILLSFFLVLVLTAIGISKGSIDYLKKQMDSRYVTLTSVKIPSGFDKEILNQLNDLNFSLYNLSFNISENEMKDSFLNFNKRLSLYIDTIKKIERRSIPDSVSSTFPYSFELERIKEINNNLNNLNSSDTIKFLDRVSQSEFSELENTMFFREFKSFLIKKENNRYGIKRTFPVFEEIRTFVNPNNPKSEYKIAQIRKGMNNDPIINDFKGHSFNHMGWGCIVTKGFLKELGYQTEQVPYISYLKNINGLDNFIKIPVEGIIDDLPDYLDMIVGEKLYKSFQDFDYWQELITESYNNDYVRLFVESSNLEIESKILEYGLNKIDHNIFCKGFLYEKNGVDSLTKIKILKDLNSFNNIHEVFDFYRISSNNSNEDFPEDKYVFQFHNDSINKIKDFNKILVSKYKHGKEFLKIDLSIINSKRNFDIIKDLVELLSWAIYFLSLLSIFLYLWNLIVNHINSNKKNLGTLKAFGLSNFTIVGIYSFISITMIVISLMVAFVVSFLLGQNIMDFLTNLLNLENLSEMKFLPEELKNLFLIFIIIPSFILMLMIYNKLKNKTPGDLIYERNNN